MFACCRMKFLYLHCQLLERAGAAYSPDKYKKVIVVVLAKNEQARKIAEDQVASNYKALQPSYPLFTPKQLGDDTLSVKK